MTTPAFHPPPPIRYLHRYRHHVHSLLLLLLSLQCLFVTQFYLYYGGTSRGRQWFRDVSSMILLFWKRGDDDEEEEGDANARRAALVILGTLALPAGIAGGASVLLLTTRRKVRRRELRIERERGRHDDDEDDDEEEDCDEVSTEVPPSRNKGVVASSKKRNSPRRRFRRWIASLFRRPSRFAAAFVLFPCLVFFACNVQRHVSSSSATPTESLHADDIAASPNRQPRRLLLVHLANDLGILALLSFSHLLLPVSPHSPLVRLLRWSPVEAAVLHKWAGRLAIAATGGHGALHLAGAWRRWIDRAWHPEKERHVGGASFWRGYLPPSTCWKHAAADRASLDPSRFGHGCPREDGRCVCYDLFVNLTGLLGLLALVVLLVSSVEYVRRRRYRFFYVMHISMAPLFLLMATLHYNRTILYLSPSLLYYAATALPARLQSRGRRRRRPRGTRILSVAAIPCPTPRRPDGAVLDVVFAASPRAAEEYRPGHHCTVRVLSLSLKSHPFTVAAVPGRDDRLRILMKTAGPFTTELARRFDAADVDDDVDVDVESPVPPSAFSPPTMHIDGFRGLPHRWHRHDVVVLAAGGIGITPFLSLLVDAASDRRRAGSSGRTEAVELHWTCRDAGLIRHVYEHYVSYILREHAGDGGGAKDEFPVRVTVTIHHTGPAHVVDPLPTVYDFESSSFDIDDDTSPMMPSSFAVGARTDISRNILHFVTYASIFSLGLSSLWIFAARMPSKDDMVGRIRPLIALTFLSLGISFLAVARVASVSRSDDENDDDARPLISGDTYGSFASPPTEGRPSPPFDAMASRTAGNVTYRFRRGVRPHPREVVSSLKGARTPALFVCGPKGLVTSLREEVRGRESEGDDCEIYEEVFEM
mmetsp:Transcript_2779/g.6621  ORF Transcript_2779/g.6621 Transcript_2779/m.6621 type:complete len:875 (+) Transcript_2779:217-2841(+)